MFVYQRVIYPDPSTTVPQRSRIGPLFDGPSDHPRFFRETVSTRPRTPTSGLIRFQSGGFSPSWIVDFMKSPSKIWMMTGGSQYFFLKSPIVVGEIGANLVEIGLTPWITSRRNFHFGFGSSVAMLVYR